jgi:hypothetical protein
VRGGRRVACTPARGWLGGAARVRQHCGPWTRGTWHQGRGPEWRFHSAWTGGQKPASACGPARSWRGWRATPTRRRALWTPGLKPFRQTPFDRVFLQIFQLKWTKRSTAKL